MTQPAATLELGKLADALSAASGQGIERAAEALLSEGAQLVQQQAQSYAPRRTGRMAESITTTATGPLQVQVGPHVSYAPYVEYGTRPHVIRPRRPGGVLVFTVAGRKVVARSVRHPGTAAHPFMRPAATDAADTLAAGLGQAGSDVIVQEHS